MSHVLCSKKDWCQTVVTKFPSIHFSSLSFMIVFSFLLFGLTALEACGKGSSCELQHPPLSVWVWGWNQLLCFYSSTSADRECLASHVPQGNHVMHNLRVTCAGLFFSGFCLRLISLLFLHGQCFLETMDLISDGKRNLILRVFILICRWKRLRLPCCTLTPFCCLFLKEVLLDSNANDGSFISELSLDVQWSRSLHLKSLASSH